MVNHDNVMLEYKTFLLPYLNLSQEIEINQTLLNVYNSTLQINSLSKKFSLQKYLNFDQDDLRYNEEAKLREMGISEEDIKKMEQAEIDNIVYGTPSAKNASKYGLQVDENKSGW